MHVNYCSKIFILPTAETGHSDCSDGVDVVASSCSHFISCLTASCFPSQLNTLRVIYTLPFSLLLCSSAAKMFSSCATKNI